jgi:uncharacterized membrane protein
MRGRTADRITVVLAVAGLCIAGYLTLLHYDSHIPLVCSAGSFVNCETVLASPSATVWHVPVAVWGLVWFAVALGLAVGALRSEERAGSSSAPATRSALLAWSAAGTVGVLYLIYQEVGVIGKLCAWCTAVHVIIISMLIVQTQRAVPLQRRS